MSEKDQESPREEVPENLPSSSKEPLYSMGSWDETQKRFLKQMIDRAKCYIWLYDRSFRLYKTLWLVYMIPVLIITTFSGVANLGQLGLSDPNLVDSQKARIVYPIILGLLNIFAAILTSLVQYFKIAEQKEAHRRAGKDWQQFSTDMEILFYAQFKIEVRSKKFEKMLGRYKQLLDRNPSIPKIYLRRLQMKYGEENGNGLDKEKQLVLPEIVGQIQSIEIKN
jgi:hypothetical protein